MPVLWGNVPLLTSILKTESTPTLHEHYSKGKNRYTKRITLIDSCSRKQQARKNTSVRFYSVRSGYPV